jgi:fatty acid desaturase
MVPTPIIMLILLVAWGPSGFSYLFSWPKRRLMNPYFAVLAASVGLMLFTLILAIFSVEIVWLSWVLLASAILLVFRSIVMLRRSLAVMRENDRQIAERRMRGG